MDTLADSYSIIQKWDEGTKTHHYQNINSKGLIPLKGEEKDFKKHTEMLCYLVAKNSATSACGKLRIWV